MEENDGLSALLEYWELLPKETSVSFLIHESKLPFNIKELKDLKEFSYREKFPFIFSDNIFGILYQNKIFLINVKQELVENICKELELEGYFYPEKIEQRARCKQLLGYWQNSGINIFEKMKVQHGKNEYYSIVDIEPILPITKEASSDSAFTDNNNELEKNQKDDSENALEMQEMPVDEKKKLLPKPEDPEPEERPSKRYTVLRNLAITHLFFAVPWYILLIVDGILYERFPNERYGNTATDILLGTSPNLNGYTTHFGNYLPQQYFYEMSLVIPRMNLAIPMAYLLLSVFVYKLPFYRALNFPVVAKNYKFIKALFAASWAFVSYPFIRLVETVAKKILSRNEYLNELENCQRQGKDYTYIAPLGNSFCTDCGNWPEVSYSHFFSQQDCFDDLMRYPRQPELLIERLQSLPHLNGLIYLDLSQQNWLKWPVRLWEKFLNLIRNCNFNSVNISQQLAGNHLSDYLPALQDFIQHQTNMTEFYANGLNITGAQCAQLFNHNNGRLRLISLRNNQLDDDDMNSIVFLIRQFLIQTLDLESNQFTDNGVEVYFSFLPNSTITETNLNSNLLTGETLKIISQYLPQTRLEKLSVSNHDFSQGDFGPLGQAISASPFFQEMQADNCGIGDLPFVEWMQALNGKTMSSISCHNNGIGSDGVMGSLPYMRTLNLTHLGFGNNPVDLNALSYLLSSLNGSLTSIDMQNSIYGNQLISILNRLANIRKVKIDHTNCDDNAANDIGQLLIKLSSFKGSRNNFGQKTAQAIVKNLSQAKDLKELDVAENLMETKDLKPIFEQLPGSSLESFNITDNPFDEWLIPNLGSYLITETPLVHQLATLEDLSPDEGRALNQAKNKTNLKNFYAGDKVYTNKAQQALCFYAYPAKLNVDSFLPHQDNLARPYNWQTCINSEGNRNQPGNFLLFVVLGWMLYQFLSYLYKSLRLSSNQHSLFYHSDTSSNPKSGQLNLKKFH